ncbi:hypothetical protein [Methylobacterium tarhaniae]|uniref:hypothetical protein n=1 Tax=Methylobacterium tarhaniae TaxID=1187852 RepID=UPI003CFF1A90
MDENLTHLHAGMQVISADRYQVSGTIDSTVLQGVDAVSVAFSGQVLGSAAIKSAHESRHEFCVILNSMAQLNDHDVLQIRALTPSGEVDLCEVKVVTAVTGGIDRCSDSLVRGWAANLNRPDVPLEVEIYVNGKYRGVTRADRSRSDLTLLGKQFTSTGFLFKFSPALDILAPGSICVTARVKKDGSNLVHSPWLIKKAFDRAPVLHL